MSLSGVYGRVIWRAVAVAMAAASMMLVAVFGSSTSTAKSVKPSATSARANAGVAAARQLLARYSKIPSFKSPGPAFNARKLMRGKTVFSVPLNSSDQFVQVLENGNAAIAKSIGFKYRDYTNSGSLSAWVQGIQTGVTEHANVIDLLSGINPALLQPQIRTAKRSHIPTVVSDAYDLNQPSAPNVGAVMNVPYAQAGRLMAAYTISATNGKADVLVITSNDVVSSPYMGRAIKQEFSAYCKACKVKTINVPVADWASQTETQVEAALHADPKINYILPVYDSQSQFVVPAITASGDSGKVFIVTYDGTPFVLKMMQDGNTVKMDVGEDLNWISYAIMDQDMRIAAGLKPSRNENTPMMIFTKKNVNTAGIPPKNSTGYGKSYIVGYEKLWGLH